MGGWMNVDCHKFMINPIWFRRSPKSRSFGGHRSCGCLEINTEILVVQNLVRCQLGVRVQTPRLSFLAVWAWMSYLTPLCLICKKGLKIIIPHERIVRINLMNFFKKIKRNLARLKKKIKPTTRDPILGTLPWGDLLLLNLSDPLTDWAPLRQITLSIRILTCVGNLKIITAFTSKPMENLIALIITA